MLQLSNKKDKARGLHSYRDMDDPIEKARRFADLSGYPLKKRLMIRCADLAFYGLIKLIGCTARFEVEGWEHWETATRNGGIPIYAFWHGDIFLTTYWWRRRDIVVMTSQSFDGEYIARFIQRFGYGAVRGSSTRGSVGALIEMIRLVRLGQATAFTIDGPKGPRHVAKMGAMLLAKKTGQPVVPVTVTPASYWSLTRTWDAMRIPRPFTAARVEVAAPIFVPPDANEAVLEAKRGELQEALDNLERRGQQWRVKPMG